MPDETLTVRAAVAGDQGAMRALWSRYAPYVDAAVRRLVGDPDAAADIAQEVWIRIFRALPSWRGDSQFSTWAHRIAVNLTLNALRRQRRLDALHDPLAEDSAATEPADAAPERAMLARSIDEAVARLPAGARTVFVLHDVEGHTHEEIAAQLGISVGASKSQLFKARARLRRWLAPLLEDRESGDHHVVHHA